MADNNTNQETTIENLLGEAKKVKREALERQRSSDLDIARLHAMSDVMKNLFVPVAWRAGGGGTTYTSPVKSDDKGYLDAFKRAQAANASLLNLDADYQDALTNQKIKDFYRDEQRAYAEGQRDEQREYAKKEKDADRKYAEQQEKSRREYTRGLYKTQYGGKTQEPVNHWASGGRKLAFDNEDKRNDFYGYVDSLMGNRLYSGIDDTMTDKAKAATMLQNRNAFIDEYAESLYDAWKYGTEWKGASNLPSWMTSGESNTWALDWLYGLSGGAQTPASTQTSAPASSPANTPANSGTLNIDSIFNAYGAID